MAGRLNGYWTQYNTFGNIQEENEDDDSSTVGLTLRRFDIGSFLSVVYGFGLFFLTLALITVVIKYIVSPDEDACWSTHMNDGYNYMAVLFIVSDVHMVVTFILEIYFRRINEAQPVTSHHKVNASVKLGLYLFAVVTVSVNLVVLAKREYNMDICYHANAIVFVTMQTVYLNRYSKACFQNLEILHRFGITQILVTNLSYWALLVSYETCVDYCFKEPNGTSMYHQILPYLMDCTVEYCLIAAVLLANMWQNIGKVPKQEFATRRKWIQGIKSSMYGIVAGVIVAITVSVIGIYLVQIPLNPYASRDGNFIKCSVDLRISLAVTVVVCATSCAFWLELTSCSRDEAMPGITQDGVLLFCCCGFHMMQDILSLMASIIHYNKENDRYSIALWDSIFVLTACFMQTAFVILGLVSKSAKEERKMLVKNVLIFLSITNFSLWMLSHYELRIDSLFYPMERKVYGKLFWYFIHHVTGPIVSFYYFHSAACLFDIWIAVP